MLFQSIFSWQLEPVITMTGLAIWINDVYAS